MHISDVSDNNHDDRQSLFFFHVAMTLRKQLKKFKVLETEVNRL